MNEIRIGISKEKECLVNESMLATAVGSGDMDVYATPMMIAFMEHVSYSLLQEQLMDEFTSVGIHVDVAHKAPTPCNMKVRVIATVIEVSKKIVSFKVEAYDEKGLIGEGIHKRYIVEKEEFQSKAMQKIKNEKKEHD